MLGRNPFGSSFVVGYGPGSPIHPHHWASVFGQALPTGAVVGGPAPIDQIRGQGFHVQSPFDSSFASYEDRRADYVTSEPALDYAAASRPPSRHAPGRLLLLIAAPRRRSSGWPPNRVPRPMAANDVAFAGLARQAEMVRAGEVSPRELVSLYLERIERLDPKLNAFRVVRAEQALAEADEAERRRGSADDTPLLGVPIAVKDTEDVAGEADHARHRCGGRARRGGLRDGEAAARRGRDRDRQDQPPRARVRDVHRIAHMGNHPQPVGLDPRPRGILRRQRGRGGGGPRLGGDGVGRRRLDPLSPPPTARCSASSHSAAGCRSTRRPSTGTGCPSTAT